MYLLYISVYDVVWFYPFMSHIIHHSISSWLTFRASKILTSSGSPRDPGHAIPRQRLVHIRRAHWTVVAGESCHGSGAEGALRSWGAKLLAKQWPEWGLAWYSYFMNTYEYPPVNVYITMEDLHFCLQSPLFLWPFSIIAIVCYCDITRGYVFQHCPTVWMQERIFRKVYFESSMIFFGTGESTRTPGHPNQMGRGNVDICKATHPKNSWSLTGWRKWDVDDSWWFDVLRIFHGISCKFRIPIDFRIVSFHHRWIALQSAYPLILSTRSPKNSQENVFGAPPGVLFSLFERTPGSEQRNRFPSDLPGWAASTESFQLSVALAKKSWSHNHYRLFIMVYPWLS